MGSRPKNDYLFSDGDWYGVEQNQKAHLKEEAQKIDGERFLNTSTNDLCKYLVNRFRVDVPYLLKDELEVDQMEAQVDVSQEWARAIHDRSRPSSIPGTSVVVTVPFTGEAILFRVRPTSFTLNPPTGQVRERLLTLTLTGLQLTPDVVKSWIERTLGDIEEHLSNLRASANTLNSQLETMAKQLVEKRREKLLADRNLVSQLGYKIKARKEVSQTYKADSVRRRVTPTLPSTPNEKFKPEPALSEVDFEHILSVMQNMTQVMERSPSAFASMDEEALRSHFLVQLNGHYEGQAMGEVFNYSGKTDILIRVDGKNIFIGECKYWAGPKTIQDTLDQLLGYSSWRDTKVAVIIFNRNKNFTQVLKAIQEEVKKHKNYKRSLGPRSETDFRYAFRHQDDVNRELSLAVLAFDVPK